MAATKDEREQILQLVETGQLSSREASELFDALEDEQERHDTRSLLANRRDRLLRVRATTLGTQTKAGKQRVHVTATIPVSLVRAALRLGVQVLPQLKSNSVEDLLSAIDRGASGRLLDLQDLENGERLEIFIE
ncbi:SHOCT-like domain-containing protein [Ktedonobacter racemifer]|uniref:YvlB/LiaX N-terminal domain-containing protein n=1 Tax=Ktedonobacter racemifer DSM 44963 TaxID=485913 RepID=D6TDW6_KTERA|nr:hypothetical protein [Ktedonobacter racemifer]EFH90248.1 conserved hypothetical protein [Ktedonobacter racemifer DSM 44963]